MTNQLFSPSGDLVMEDLDSGGPIQYRRSGDAIRPFRVGEAISARSLNWISIRSWVALLAAVAAVVISVTR